MLIGVIAGIAVSCGRPVSVPGCDERQPVIAKPIRREAGTR